MQLWLILNWSNEWRNHCHLLCVCPQIKRKEEIFLRCLELYRFIREYWLLAGRGWHGHGRETVTSDRTQNCPNTTTPQHHNTTTAGNISQQHNRVTGTATHRTQTTRPGKLVENNFTSFDWLSSRGLSRYEWSRRVRDLLMRVWGRKWGAAELAGLS